MKSSLIHIFPCIFIISYILAHGPNSQLPPPWLLSQTCDFNHFIHSTVLLIFDKFEYFRVYLLTEDDMSGLSRGAKAYLQGKFGNRANFNQSERVLYSHDIAAMPGLLKPLVGNDRAR